MQFLIDKHSEEVHLTALQDTNDMPVIIRILLFLMLQPH